jgi:hypothetical protein
MQALIKILHSYMVILNTRLVQLLVIVVIIVVVVPVGNMLVCALRFFSPMCVLETRHGRHFHRRGGVAFTNTADRVRKQLLKHIARA